jgi:H+/Cl- antiporter ClcA
MRHFKHLYRSRLALVVQSIVTGFLVGLVIASVRAALGKTHVLREALYHYLKEAPPRMTLYWIIVLIAGGALIGLGAKFRPLVRGGGVPEVKAHLQKRLKLRWRSELPLKWLCPVMAISAGLSLGWEGPSVQLGAYVALAVLALFKRGDASQHTLVCAGSAAGLSAAFGAPLSGVLFVIEELTPSLQPLFLACTMGASIAADAAAGLFFGLKPAFDFRTVSVLPYSAIPWLILLGVLCAFAGDLFKRLIYAGQDFYKKLPLPEIFHPIIPLLVSVPLGFFLFDATGGGHELIKMLGTENWTLSLLPFLLILLAVKLTFSALSAGSGTGGGIFIPFLSSGALIGTLAGALLIHFGIIDTAFHLNFIILGMAGLFASVVKAPVTAIVLVLEMTANMNHLMSLVTVAFSSFVTSELLSSPSIYRRRRHGRF